MIDLKTLIYKMTVDLKLLQLKICVRNNQKDRAPEELSSVFSENTERFGLFFAEDRILIPDKLKKPMVDALHFGQPAQQRCLRKVDILVVRNDGRHRKQVQQMHSMHDFR